MSDEDCTAWVLSPPPPRGLGTAEIFVRVRLTAPAALRAQTAAQAQAAGDHVIGHADGPIVLAATLAGFRVLIPTLPDAVGRALTAALDTALSAPSAMRLGAYRFEFARRVYIAGILNITPDSFYARARHAGMDAALTRAEEIVREGGDLIEIGGETAQAGPRLSPSEEIARVVPVVEAVRARYAVPVAVDTYKPEVAQAAIAAGAVLINDIAGLGEPGMAEVIAGSAAGVVIMHLHGRPKDSYRDLDVPSMMDWVGAFLRRRIAAAEAAGIPRGRILVDPGLNFGKQPSRDLELMQRLPELRNLGCPIFVATSRKDYIRDLLGLPPGELLEGTAAAVAFAVVQGANMLRVHDVQAMVRVVRMTEHLAGYPGTHAPRVEERRDVTDH